MKVSDLMQAMAEAGAPMEAILIAVRAIEDRDDAIEAKRAVERERKRRQRARDTDGTVTGQSRDTDGTVTGQSRDTDGTVTDTPPLSLDKETPPTPPKEINPNPPVGGCVSRAREEFPRPPFADPQVWRDFLVNRKRKRLSNSPTAYKKFLDDIARHADEEWPPGRLLEYATAKGWGGIYDPREQEDTHGPQRHSGNHQPAKRSGSFDAIIAARRNLGAG